MHVRRLQTAVRAQTKPGYIFDTLIKKITQVTAPRGKRRGFPLLGYNWHRIRLMPASVGFDDVTRRHIRILNTYLRKESNSGVLWSRFCFACSAGGVTIETMKAYVISQ